MRDVFVVSDHIVSPLGVGTPDNFHQLSQGRSGIKRHPGGDLSPTPFYASLFDEWASNVPSFTKFEQVLLASVQGALAGSGLPANDDRTIFILSTTKGNISLLESGERDPERLSLTGSACRVAAQVGFVHTPLVVSHACISGLQAIITGMRLLRAGRFDHAVIGGAEVISRFILSGFQSFMAVSPEPCRPFDASRMGVTLGEAAGTVVLSTTPLAERSGKQATLRLLGGSVSNDANHISGPSRTGEELYLAIRKALSEASITAHDVDFISAHGTATVYNDDMEARAFHLAGLQEVPLNSLKGYYGHTLGAASLIESIVSMQSLRENLVLPTLGFQEPGTVKPVNVCTSLLSGTYHHCLKTASGFGGCNAAIVMQKE